MTVTFGSVCSGIEAASVAWGPLGWKADWFSEIEPFPCALLTHHYPDVPNLGDMTALPARILSGEITAPDILCGGTPCQAFSVAGKRKSLDDARGNLSLTFCEVANAIDSVRAIFNSPPCVVFWENVPGVLNTKDNAFGCFLAGLAGESLPLEPAGGRWANAGCVYGPKRAVAWRTLDAQYFGVAQRRRRVFVIASARDGFDPARVLFESEGVRRDTPPSREAGQEIARCHAPGTGSRDNADKDTFACGGIGAYAADEISAALLKTGQDLGNGCEALIAHTLRGEGFDASEDGTGRGTPLVLAMAGNCIGRQPENGGNGPGFDASGVSYTLTKTDQHGVAVLPALVANGDAHSGFRDEKGLVCAVAQVRRLTPRECERLQGFPDDYTLVPFRKKPAAHGNRYKALGNSWAVPVVRWLGWRMFWFGGLQ